MVACISTLKTGNVNVFIRYPRVWEKIFLSVGIAYVHIFIFRQQRVTTHGSHAYNDIWGEITFAKLNRKIFYGARIVYAKSSNIKEIYENEEEKNIIVNYG